MNTPPLWLVRTSKNILIGPLAQSELINKIRAQEMSLQDEVCPASGYWFALQESELLQQHLGIHFPIVSVIEDATDRIELTQAIRIDGLEVASPVSTEVPRSEGVRNPFWRRLDILIPLFAAFLLLFMLRVAFG